MKDKFSLIRRRIILGIAGTTVLPSYGLAKTATLTPAQTEGPFYPIRDQFDKDLDLTQISGKTNKAQGKIIFVTGKIVSQSGQPIKHATVEIWQANTWGRYNHERDPNRAPLDPNFQGWGEIQTGVDGVYRFKTIFPGIYPAGPGWQRPPHIHFKVRKRGYKSLTTQMYFPAEKLNKDDRILQNIPSEQQHMLISQSAPKSSDKQPVYLFDIVLAE